MTIKVTRLQAGGYTAQDDRNNNTAMMTKTAPVTAKSGIVPSDGTDFAVSAQGTPNMTVNVAKGDLVIADAAGGAYIFHSDATKVVTITTAPPSGTRYDVIYARVYDNAAGDAQATSNITLPGSAGTQAVQTITGDIEVIAGTAGGSPTPPALPNTRCVVLKVVAVGTNVTSINNGNLQDSQSTTSRIGFTVAAGGILPVASSAVYPVTPYIGMTVYDVTLDQVLRWNGSAWKAINNADTGWINVVGGIGYQNSWITFGAAAQYRLIGNREQVLGSVQGGSSGTSAFTLPVGHRPKQNLEFACQNANTTLNSTTKVTVASTGVVQPENNTYAVYLDSISFYVD